MYTYNGNMEDFRGVYSLLLTPFCDDKSIDFEALKAYTEWQVSENPHNLFAVCGSSEMVTMTLEERLQVAKTIVSRSGNVPVFATGNLSQGTYEEQVDEVKKMSDTGIDGLVFVTKDYGEDQNKMFEYLSDLAQHTTLPIVLYEFPGFPNNKMSGETYGKLVKTGQFVGIKDTTCTIPLIKDKIDTQGDSAVLQANITYLYESYKEGARGVVATPSTCGTYMLRKMYDAFFVENDSEKAEMIHRYIDIFANGVDNGFTSSAKYMVNLCGVKMNIMRRDGKTIDERKKHSLKILHDFMVSHDMMVK